MGCFFYLLNYKTYERQLNEILKKRVCQAIKENKLIAIVRDVPLDKIVSLAQALYDGGIRLLEITYFADGSVADTTVAEAIKLLAETFKEKMYIGAGTVLTVSQVKLTYDAGGCFIISPNVSESVINETCKLDMVSIPGALTPTEIVNAKEFGADFIKLFPITTLGTSYVKAIKAPLTNVDLLAVGGIDENNMADYLNVGISGFGVGTNIINKKMIKEGDFEGITQLAKKYMAVLNGGN